MGELDKILAEHSKWKREFDTMPLSGNCDAGCGKLAKHWFGNTNQATCGDRLCYDSLVTEYNELSVNIKAKHNREDL